jgi:BlaI family transcriptional regulator, penicillinase repressor
MAARSSTERKNGRHAILDLAPLELDCLRALWPMGEGSVRDIHEALRANTPRAYTTIMTILDRMARKGIVSRRKTGRAWMYSPNISAASARAKAVERLVECFFAGSPEALAMQLSKPDSVSAEVIPRPEERVVAPRVRVQRDRVEQATAPASARRMDDVLL